jgi:glycosyltransferase involved in cell wall biosynthesis
MWDEAPILFDMKPLRVAVVADVLLAQIGGVSRSVGAIVNELARLDPERLQVTVVASRHPLGLDGIPFRRSFAPWVPKLPNSLFALQRPFTLRDFDLVHYMDSRPPLDFPLGRTPNVVTQHGFSVLTFGGPMQAGRRYIYLNKALLRLAPHADLTLTASESERQELLRLSPIDPARVIAIHHGVDHDRFFPPADLEDARAVVSESFGIQTPYLLYVSNHQRKKNTERLVEAFALVAREEPDVSLVLTGWQTPRFRLVPELIERLDLLSRVKVLGHVPDEVLPSLYGAANAFALPSLHEGFGLPILEAMACGTPVLTSNVYALPEVAGDAAELVDPLSVEEIAAGLLRILRDGYHTATLRERGLRRAREFTWERSAKQHLQAYERALG